MISIRCLINLKQEDRRELFVFVVLKVVYLSELGLLTAKTGKTNLNLKIQSVKASILTDKPRCFVAGCSTRNPPRHNYFHYLEMKK